MLRDVLKPTLLKIWLLLITLPLQEALMAVGCADKAPVSPAASPPPLTTAVLNLFVGDDACRSCHPTEFKAHSASRHAATLHPANRQSLGRSMPPLGRIPGTDIVLAEKQGALWMTVLGGPEEWLPLDLAFGSGKTGMTYVAFFGPQVMELHKSYFPHLHRWFVTPGHEHRKSSDVGMMYNPQATQACVHCHAVTVADGAVKPEPRFFGVGCESCHGAGGAHVAAMQSGRRTDSSMADLSALDATSLNTLCARCHRAGQNVNMQTEQAKMTNRFQPYGLMQSRCFRESGNKLSCLTWHDPHTDASTNLKTYEAACLTCHSPAAPKPASVGQANTAHACQVNRVSGCIGCHMPKRKVFSQLYEPVSMADHDIRIYPKHAPR